MNEPVRIVADWLAGTTGGSTSVAAILALSDFPKDSADSVPSWTVSELYDSTRHGFAARGEFPRDASVTYPCIVVGFGGMRWDDEPKMHTGNAKLEPGEVTVVVTIAHRLQDSDEGVEDVGYLLRAVRGSLSRLHDPDTLQTRERNGVKLLACTNQSLSPIRSEVDDKFIGVALTLTYDTHETLPLPD